MSTYVPFFRRFTDEKGRDLDEARQLYAWVKARQDAFSETPVTVGKRVYAYLDDLPDDLDRPFLYALHDFMEAETQMWALPAPDFERMSLKEFVEYRIRAKERGTELRNQFLDRVGVVAEARPEGSVEAMRRAAPVGELME